MSYIHSDRISHALERALRVISEEQGIVRLGILNPGDGDDAHYSVYVSLERDGLIIDKTNLSKEEFIRLVTDLASKEYQWPKTPISGMPILPQ